MGQKTLQSFMRRWHRRLAIVIGLQFFAWTLGGAYFAWFHIDNVRGQYDVKPKPEAKALDTESLLAITELKQKVDLAAIHSVELIQWRGRWVYWFKHDSHQSRLVEASTGQLLSPISSATAEAIAKDDFAHNSPILSTVLLQQHNSEYKGPLPAFQISFDHPKQSKLYVHANSGRVTARRNWIWRGFDFLWMLHIMDFEEREDFNNWLLKLMSILGLVTLASGYGLWFLTSQRFRRFRMKLLGP
ncbi:PepSY domain-containing protein [uncultured Pseudoteredinibacter sp.]|uniref:PepSY domain-containing protein n=1 Tax=uncultured Pseudoteredinibacter sp. TaxID=1641701 RepID=UPI002612868C|nr:PepSY domain-containing protein [uncultured Pseudoteredinibacter sp.]